MRESVQGGPTSWSCASPLGQAASLQYGAAHRFRRWSLCPLYGALPRRSYDHFGALNPRLGLLRYFCPHKDQKILALVNFSIDCPLSRRVGYG
jgi:hypothetical protein